MSERSELGEVEDARTYLKEMWRRARVNAFAHRYAAERYEAISAKSFKAQVALGLLAILAVILVYAIATVWPTAKDDNGDQWQLVNVIQLALTILSVALSSAALFYAILQARAKYEKLSQAHSSNQHSFLSIAQRCYRVKFPSIGAVEALQLKTHLEVEFEHHKFRGPEPSNEDFQQANQLIRDISEKVAWQSFSLEEEELEHEVKTNENGPFQKN